MAGGPREGPKTCVWHPSSLAGGPRDACVSPWGRFWGGAWIGKSSPGLNFRGKYTVFFNNSIFCFERFLEGPEAVLQAYPGPKRSPRGAKNDRLFLFCAPGGPKSEQALKNCFGGKWGTSKIAILLGTDAKSKKTYSFDDLLQIPKMLLLARTVCKNHDPRGVPMVPTGPPPKKFKKGRREWREPVGG